MTTFPNESDEYRKARTELLHAEAQLRDQTERVAELRRTLPLGGAVKEDYTFDELDADGNVTQVQLSELFAEGKDTLFLYGFMFGPKVEAPCPLCTSLLDSLNGAVPHMTQRINFAVVAKSPIERIKKFARARGWDKLRLLSSNSNTYHHDYFAESDKGDQMPMGNVFVKRDGAVRHSWGTELLYDKFPEYGDARHMDQAWPVWSILDFTPGGRGDFYPKLKY